MTRISLAGLAAGRENILSQYFQTHLEYTQGLPVWDSNFSNMSRFLPFYTTEIEATRPMKALCLAMSSSKVFQKVSPVSGGI